MGLPRMQHLVGLLLDEAGPSPMEVAADPVDVGSHAFSGGGCLVVVVTTDMVGGAAIVLTEGTAASIAEHDAGVRVGLLLLLHLDHCSDGTGVPTSFFFSFLENVRQFF